MATYPIKMLKDEQGQLFIPLTNSDSVVTTTGDTLEELIDTKVDKVTGKGLSTNDYTTTEKQKLAGLSNYELPKASSSTLGGIKVGTNLSINSDGVLSADAQQIDVDSALSGTSENPVQNKIVKNALDDKVDKVSGKGLSTNDYTTDEKNKLAGIAAGAEVNVNANWNAVSGDAQILNKPTKVSAFTNDAGYITSYTETDPVFNASPAADITAEDITKWNNTSSSAGTITGVSVNGTSVATTGVANITSIPASILNGTIKNGVTATTQSAGDNSTKVATTAYVDMAISNLPEPMIFKGSLGTGGTITSLPTAATANEGFTYKVITAGTYASQTAKVGDTFISDGSSWILIPSGDEPSGTVTSVTLKATSPIAIDSSSAITTSGTRTISHGNSGVTAGTYRSVTVNATGHVTAGTNPTTLSGYGITDAKIANGVITLGSNTITPLTSSSTLDATKLNGTIPSSCYTVPTKTSDLTNDSGYITGYTETDPIYSASAAATISSSDITNWNNKSTFSGNYNDLTNKPTIPSATSELTNDSNFITSTTANSTYALKSLYGATTINVGRKANTTTGSYSTAEGSNTEASAYYSHAEGDGTVSSASATHAEGSLTKATKRCAHAEGSGSEANGEASHAEGYYVDANGDYSHAEGFYSKADGIASHAEGYMTYAKSNYQHTIGKYNISDTNNTYVEIVGNGADDSNRSNARTLDWSGNEVLAGSLTINGNQTVATLNDIPTVPTKTSDLTNDSGYVTNTDYAGSANNSGGTVVLKTAYCTDTNSSGVLYCFNRTYSQYASMDNSAFISKGTLENVITGKGLIDNTALSPLQSGIQTNSTNIGDLSSLDTTTKTDLVSAINEVNSNMQYGVILYENDSGSIESSIPLNDSAANYQYIEIYYRTNDSDYSSVKVYQPNGKRVAINSGRVNSAASTPTFYGKTKTVYINNNTMTVVDNAIAQYTVRNATTGNVAAGDMIYITRVIGYTNTVIPNEAEIEDTGWINLTLLSGASAGANGAVPAIRRIGTHVFVRGSIAFTASSSSSVGLAEIPEGFRPAGQAYKIGATGGATYARFYYTVGGSIGCDWVYNTGGSRYSGSVTWSNIDMDWFTD